MAPLESNETNAYATADENRRFARFRERLATEGLSPMTCACYESDWWNVSEWFSSRGTRFRLEDVTAESFLSYRSARAARGVAVATLNRRLAFLRRYARFAADGDPAFDALVEALAGVPFEPVKQPIARALSRDEEERLVAAAEGLGPMEHSFVTLLVRTGIRPSEVAALVRSDVSGPAASPSAIRVRGPREKTVVLPPRTSRALAVWLAANPRGPDETLFCVRPRVPLRDSDASAIVSRAAKAAGVRATPRTLRHTFAVRYLAEHRDDVDGLSEALGPARPALVRAWRAEAHSEAEPPRLLPKTLAADGASVVRGSLVAGLRRVHPPGTEAAIDANEAEAVAFVLRGIVTIRCGQHAIEARTGDAVSIPPGTAATIRVDGARPAETLIVSSAPRKSRGGA